jgi:hypothetical protein
MFLNYDRFKMNGSWLLPFVFSRDLIARRLCVPEVLLYLASEAKWRDKQL